MLFSGGKLAKPSPVVIQKILKNALSKLCNLTKEMWGQRVEGVPWFLLAPIIK